jgi:hypothetical protein
MKPPDFSLTKKFCCCRRSSSGTGHRLPCSFYLAPGTDFSSVAEFGSYRKHGRPTSRSQRPVALFLRGCHFSLIVSQVFPQRRSCPLQHCPRLIRASSFPTGLHVGAAGHWEGCACTGKKHLTKASVFLAL